MLLDFLAASGGLDSSPDAYSFTCNTGNTISTSVVSTPITPIGYNSPSPIAVTGTSAGYSINNGSFTGAAGTICPTQNVRVCFTTSASFSTTTCATLCIGQPATCGYFCATTRVVDTTPDTFSLCCYSNVTPSTYCTGSFVVTGIDCTYVCALSNTTAYVCTPAGGWGAGPLCVCNNQTIGYCVCTPAGFGAVATYCVCVGTCLACGKSTNLNITAPALPFAAKVYKQDNINGNCHGWMIFDFCNNYTDFYFTDSGCMKCTGTQCCSLLPGSRTCAQLGMDCNSQICVEQFFMPVTHGACKRLMTFGACCLYPNCSNFVDLIHSSDCGCTWTKITNCCCPTNRGATMWCQGTELCFVPVVTTFTYNGNCGCCCYNTIPKGRFTQQSYNRSVTGDNYFCSMGLAPNALCCPVCLGFSFNVECCYGKTGPFGNDQTNSGRYPCRFSNTVHDHGYYYMAYASIEPWSNTTSWCSCLSCITILRSRAGTECWESTNWDIRFSPDGYTTDYYFGGFTGWYTPVPKLRTFGTADRSCTWLQLGLDKGITCAQGSCFGFQCMCGQCVKSPQYDYYFGQVVGYNAPQAVAFYNAAEASLSSMVFAGVPSSCSYAGDGGLTYASNPYGQCGYIVSDWFSHHGLSVYYAGKCNNSGGCQISLRVSHKNGIQLMCGSYSPCCTCAGQYGQTYTSYSGSYQCDCCISNASCPYLCNCSCCFPPFGYGIVGNCCNLFLSPVMSYAQSGNTYLNNHGIGAAGYVTCCSSSTIKPFGTCCRSDNAGNCSPITTQMPWVWYACATGANNSGALCVTTACNTNPNFSWLCQGCTGPSVNCGGTAWACWTIGTNPGPCWCGLYFMYCPKLI